MKYALSLACCFYVFHMNPRLHPKPISHWPVLSYNAREASDGWPSKSMAKAKKNIGRQLGV
jgi:hypothetical protein